MRLKIFLILVFLFNFLAHNMSMANDTDALTQSLETLGSAVSRAGTVDYKGGCATCVQTTQNPKSYSLFSKDNNQKIELTVVSEEAANKLFNEMTNRNDIPFGYPMDGCYARAHKMARLLEDKGIIVGKAFLEGQLFVDTKFGEIGWGYHVAPVIMVNKGNTTTPYIFDPSLFDKPVTFEAWKAKMSEKSKTKIEKEFFTNRFAYDPDDRLVKRSEYAKEAVEDMDKTNNDHLHLLAMYNESIKQRN